MDYLRRYLKPISYSLVEVPDVSQLCGFDSGQIGWMCRGLVEGLWRIYGLGFLDRNRHFEVITVRLYFTFFYVNSIIIY